MGREHPGAFPWPQLAEIGRLFDEGALQVGVDSTYPLPAAGSAHVRAAQGHVQGEIVLAVVP
ncbi:zinc-binding dehydrogenase [Streptomyces prasinus]